MVFSSPIFLFLFLPLVLGLYALCPRPVRNPFLLAVSLLFYAWGEPTFILVMLVSTTMNYAFGLWIERWRSSDHVKWLVAIAVAANLGLLAYYKYAAFLVENLNALLLSLDLRPVKVPQTVLPLGISFFTFQAMSYVIDVYRRDGRAQRNPINVALYIALFPQLIAGPIVRFHDIAEQLLHRVTTLGDFAEGVKRFIVGLGKKVLIANGVGATADAIFELQSERLSPAVAWLGLTCYALQIYFDFSGYSDMAIGLGRMFGFRFAENFNYPYIAHSITDFWRRWHISLSSWFRDYLYVPLGGNRVAAWRVYLNLMTVFLLCGLWHGAGWNFVLWGALHGTLLIFERLGWCDALAKRQHVAGHIYVLFFVALSWVPFRATDFSHAVSYYMALFGAHPAAEITEHIALYLRPGMILALVTGIVGSMPTMRWVNEVIAKPKTGATASSNVVAYGGVAALMLVLVASMIELSASTYNPFIYFRF